MSDDHHCQQQCQVLQRRRRSSSSDKRGPFQSLSPILVSLLILTTLLLLLPPPTALAVLIGDEQYGRQEGGVFWTFSNQGVSIVNPETCHLEHSFSHDAWGGKLPEKWSKGVYMEVQTPTYNDDDVPLTETPELLPRTPAYILINSGENTVGGGGAGISEVIVMDTTSGHKTPVLKRIEVGGSLGHAYGVQNRNQFWTHSDSEGFFYVIDIKAELKEDAGHPIKAKITTAPEGELLWEIGVEDDTLNGGGGDNNLQIGYATSRKEPTLFILDMESHKQIDNFDLTENAAQGTCQGAASMAYSKINQHLYIECYGQGGILEYDVSYPRSPVFVKQHLHIGGTLLETPDQVYVTATDKGANVMHFFRPLKTGEASTDPERITVEGHPEWPIFYEDKSTYDYIACLPLTQTVNRAHIKHSTTKSDENGQDVTTLFDQIVCDYYNGCAQAETQEDVQHGMCLYADKKHTKLLSATESQLNDVQNNKEPFGRACFECAHERNYHHSWGGDKECICTPQCGTCAPDAYPTEVDDPLLLATGIRCIDVKDALLQVIHHSDLIPGAGAIGRNKVAEDGGGATCGFEEPYRAHKRGGNFYDASISTVPHNELIVIDMRVQSLKCRVALPGTPQQVVYVPTTYHYKSGSSGDGLSGGAIAGIVIAAVFVVGIFGWFSSRGSRYAHQDSIEKQAEMVQGEQQQQQQQQHPPSIEMTNGGTNGHKEEKRGEQAAGSNFVIGDDDEQEEVAPMSSRMPSRSNSSTTEDNPNVSVHSGQLA